MSKYRLAGPPEPTTDGSGLVAHDMFGIEDDGTIIPGRHATIMVPEAELDVVLAMPDANGAQRQAKNDAYKELLRQYAPQGWEDNDLQDIVSANGEASTAAAGADSYITGTLGQVYPVDFSL